jgi:hypothetical protein
VPASSRCRHTHILVVSVYRESYSFLILLALITTKMQRQMFFTSDVLLLVSNVRRWLCNTDDVNYKNQFYLKESLALSLNMFFVLNNKEHFL